jgi:hypothetical protein
VSLRREAVGRCPGVVAEVCNAGVDRRKTDAVVVEASTMVWAAWQNEMLGIRVLSER